MFQFLIGTLVTEMEGIKGDMAFAVSIPHRYASNKACPSWRSASIPVSIPHRYASNLNDIINHR